jgi:ribosomal protein L37AE/L43A
MISFVIVCLIIAAVLAYCENYKASLCPHCKWPTHPHEYSVTVWYCRHCGKLNDDIMDAVKRRK